MHSLLLQASFRPQQWLRSNPYPPLWSVDHRLTEVHAAGLRFLHFPFRMRRAFEPDILLLVKPSTLCAVELLTEANSESYGMETDRQLLTHGASPVCNMGTVYISILYLIHEENSLVGELAIGTPLWRSSGVRMNVDIVGKAPSFRAMTRLFSVACAIVRLLVRNIHVKQVLLQYSCKQFDEQFD